MHNSSSNTIECASLVGEWSSSGITDRYLSFIGVMLLVINEKASECS